MFSGKTFLITGGTGSFGQTLIRHLINTDVARIVVFSRDEAKQHLMRVSYPDQRIQFIIGDTRNESSVKRALKGVNFVFHAAALKQVPAGENFPWEFVQTNVVGSNNLLTNLDSAGVEKAVFLSTDKAVYPVNAMGMSKALMEKLVRSENYNLSSIPLITRYGNVIGSRGSVIPAFIESIKNTNSVEITDENMTRFMMSLDQSVGLVLYALGHGSSGDLFVQKAPSASVKVLVDALEIIFQRKIERKYVGIRPGEKIHESLLTAEEFSNAIESDQYFQVPRIVSPDTGGKKQFVDYSSHTTHQLKAEELSNLLLTIPEVTQLISNS